jgi:hypothetical protein
VFEKSFITLSSGAGRNGERGPDHQLVDAGGGPEDVAAAASPAQVRHLRTDVVRNVSMLFKCN